MALARGHAMRIKKLNIRSFRGIHALTLDFPDTQTTVLIGNNGAGKTAILDCIASLFSLMFQNLKLDSDTFEITDEDRKFY